MKIRTGAAILQLAAAIIGFISVYSVATKVHGAEPKIPSEIKIFKKGICVLSPAGIMVEEGKGLYERKCSIGIDPKNPAMRYIITYDNNGNIESVIEGNPERVQKVIYRRGAKKI